MKEQILRCSRRGIALFCLGIAAFTVCAQTPVAVHGQLSVDGNRIKEKSGNEYQLRGMSLFWSNWMGKYWNYETIKWLRDDWHCNMVRAAMGVSPDDNSGYLGNPVAEKQKMITVIEAAIDLGIYVVVDWHSHKAQNTAETEAAILFFAEIAQKYGSYPNIIYETYNEPNTGWSEVKAYHEAVVAEIRKYDKNNVIVLGTPSYSQEVQVAVSDPVNNTNLAYVLHYYAASHDNLQGSVKPIMDANKCLFVSEFGTCEYTGSGELDKDASNVWWNLLDSYNISWANWSVSDVAETASILVPGGSVHGGWPDAVLSESGKFVRTKLRSYPQDPVPTGIKPYITSNPQSVSVPDQSSASFSVEVVGGGTMSYKWFYNDVEIANSNAPTYTVAIASAATSGDYRAEITNANGTTVSKTATLSVRYRSLYYAAPQILPGVVQFEDYDKGGQNIGYYDTGFGNSGTAYRSDDVDIEATKNKPGEFNIGFTDIGEWLSYTVKVAWAGQYELDVYYSSAASVGSYSVQMDGADIVPASSVPNSGGWFTYAKMTKPVTLTAGEHLLKFKIMKSGFNLDYMEFRSLTAPDVAPLITAQPKNTAVRLGKSVTLSATATGAKTITYQWFHDGQPINGATQSSLTIAAAAESDAGDYTLKATNSLGSATTSAAILTVLTSPAFGGYPAVLPGRILLKNFDEGANGEAYMDGTPGNANTTATLYRTTDVDLEDCSDGGSGHSIGYVTAGEWLNYSVTVKYSGTYTVGIRVATESTTNPTFSLYVDGVKVGSSITVANTGGWTTWKTVTSMIDLVAGNHVIRIKANQGEFNMNYMDFSLPQITQSVVLEQGWNLFSLSVDPAVSSVVGVLGEVAGLVVKSNTGFYRQDQPTFLNSLSAITPGNGYAVFNPGASLTVDVVGISVSYQPTVAGLNAGWHFIAAGSQLFPLSSLGANVALAKDFTSVYTKGATSNTLTMLSPGKACFVKIE